MLLKRNKTYHCDFVIDGHRCRQSLHTTDRRVAKDRERELIAQAKEGKLATTSARSGALFFREAVGRFIEDPARAVAAKTRQTERERLHALNRVFGDRPVRSITPEQIHDYIGKRNSQGKAPATINKELHVLRAVLKRAKRWHLFSEEIKPLPVTENIGDALLHEQKVRLLHVAAMKPEWQTAYYAAVLSLNTTMRSCELKGLRWRDINMLGRSLRVLKSKTKKGVRRVPLNEPAMNVILALYRRAQQIGAAEPDHYIFFACENGHIDPTRPQKSWRSAWRSLRKVAGLPKLRFHDLRHTAVTELAEGGNSDQVIRDIAGHVSNRMLEHYSHIRMDAKRTALDALASKRPALGYDTTQDTMHNFEGRQILEVEENMVGSAGLEPAASSL